MIDRGEERCLGMLLPQISDDGAVGIHDGGQVDGRAGGFKIAIDAEMVPAKGTGPNHRDIQNRARRKRQASLAPRFPFHCPQAPAVKLKQLSDLIFRFRCGWWGKAGGRCGGASYASGRRNELEQVESDVFIPACGSIGVGGR
jgi:hypothetical protein